jgi:hypothetical protein
MRHKHFSTTQGYIALADNLRPSAEQLHVPEVLKRLSAGEG